MAFGALRVKGFVCLVEGLGFRIKGFIVGGSNR